MASAFAISSNSGRHPHFPLASVLHAYPVLDATCQISWRPFLPFSLIWTPRQSTCGVQSTLLSPYGRLPLKHMASVLHNFSNLNATHTVTWRPFCMPIMFWTPSTLPTGVHSPQLSQSGRLSFNHMASNSRAYRHLDAMLYLDGSSVNIWTPCYIRMPQPRSPEFRKLKQATAWLSINLESGQLPSSL